MGHVWLLETGTRGRVEVCVCRLRELTGVVRPVVTGERGSSRSGATEERGPLDERTDIKDRSYSGGGRYVGFRHSHSGGDPESERGSEVSLRLRGDRRGDLKSRTGEETGVICGGRRLGGGGENPSETIFEDRPRDRRESGGCRGSSGGRYNVVRRGTGGLVTRRRFGCLPSGPGIRTWRSGGRHIVEGDRNRCDIGSLRFGGDKGRVEVRRSREVGRRT